MPQSQDLFTGQLHHFIDAFDVRYYGAKGDGVTDDTVAIQAALDAAVNASGQTTNPVVAIGSFNISSSITITDVQGLMLLGGGYWATKFNWIGDATSPMFLLTNTSQCIFKDFLVIAGTALDDAFKLVQNGGLTYATGECLFQSIVVQGLSPATGVNRGWDMSEDGTAGTNGNSWHVFIHCTVHNYKEEAWRIGHVNAKNTRFFACNFNALTNVGKHGVWNKGSFQWHAGGGSRNEVADFFFGDNLDASLCIGGDFENSARLLDGSGGANSNASGAMTIQSTRWAGSGLHADGNMIDWGFQTLNLFSNQFGGANEPLTKIKHIFRGDGFHTSIGNQFIASNSIDTEPWEMDPEVNSHIEANLFRAAGLDSVSGREIPDGTATPALWSTHYFETNNTTGTTVTGFVGGNAQIGAPKIIVFKDANTTIDFTGTNLKGNAGVDWSPANGDHMTCVYDGTDWFCDISDNTA